MIDALRLTPLSADEYARAVLPHSAELWAHGRSYEAYVDDFRSFADSGFGRRRFRTLGLMIDGELVASCKRYQRELRCGERTLRAVGIGAVFTPEEQRGRGYATAMLGALLDDERAAGTGLVFLFSDIHPAFYERLGFVRLPSRTIVLRADALRHARIGTFGLDDTSWPAMQRCFAAMEAQRPWALTRPPLFWEWQRARLRTRGGRDGVVRLGLRRGRGLAAYVIGRRYPEADAFALDEVAFADADAAASIPALLRNAAGDLRKITGWLPPPVARAALPLGAVRQREEAIAMMLPLSSAARAAWHHDRAAIARGDADPCWSADHV